MNKSLNDCIVVYKQQLENSDVQETYMALMKYVSMLKAHMTKTMDVKFSFGAISPGYMDFTYFPFSDDFLKDRDLRFGIVLNHVEVRFELWLMGRNAKVQKKYWNCLKNTKWNENQKTMPKYSVLEIILIENPDFENLEKLSLTIEQEMTRSADEIVDYLKLH